MTSSPDLPSAVAGTPGPSYCPSCGSAWEPGAAGCAACERRQQARSAAVAAVLAEGHPLARALSLYFSLLAVSVILILVTALGYSQQDPARIFPGWAALTLDALLVAVWCAAGWRDLRPLLAGSRARWYLFAAAGSVATYLLASAAVQGFNSLLELQPIKLAAPVFDAGFGWPALLLTVCLQPAVVEELAFRGVILGALGRFLKPAEAVAVSSLMFMVIHLLPMSFPHLFLLGLALGWLRLRSGSLYPGMVLHFLHNLYCLLGEVWFRT